VPVPDLSVLGPSANQQNDGGQDDGEEDNDTRTSQSALLARRTQRGPLSKSFEEVGYQNVRSCEDAGEDMYFEDTQWKKNHLMVQTSSLNLFIFADKYSVHQLRDHVITALLGQANTWHWSPDPNQELITKAYDNLPESAKFHKFMVHCTAHWWLAEPGQDLAARMRSLVEWSPASAFGVSHVPARIIQKCSKESDGRYYHLADCIDDSCFFHEHLVHDETGCRERFRNKTHVFAELIDACAKDGVSMAQEYEDKSLLIATVVSALPASAL
jgi:hypothetical protein